MRDRHFSTSCVGVTCPDRIRPEACARLSPGGSSKATAGAAAAPTSENVNARRVMGSIRLPRALAYAGLMKFGKSVAKKDTRELDESHRIPLRMDHGAR